MTAQAVCHYCAAVLDADDNLCPACGRNQTNLSCAQCGFLNPAGVRFCGNCGESLSVVQPATLDAERRQLTVLFCDLVDSSALSQQLDPEDYAELLRRYREVCAAAIRRYGGTQVRYVGDGIRVYFGFPQAHEDDAERAVRAGLEMVGAVQGLTVDPGSRTLAVRVGIATGLVVAGWSWTSGGGQESEAVGETPNLAARLQSLAAPNTVVVGLTSKRLLGRLFEFDDLGPHRLKGFSRLVRVWRVEEPRTFDSRFEVTRAVHTPLVDRVHELARLLDNWDQARRSRGRVVVLSGEPGIGKSRLIRTLQQRLGQRSAHNRLYYQCSPYHGNSPLYPVINQLERASGILTQDNARTRLDKLGILLAPYTPQPDQVLPYLAELLSIPAKGLYPPPQLSNQQLKTRLFELLVEQMCLLASEQPLLLVYEDIHWIDPTSLELLNLGIRAIADRPVLMLISTRSDPETDWQSLPYVEHLPIVRLEASDSRDMIEQLVVDRRLPKPLLRQLVARSDGIPLYLEELTRTLLEQPASENGGSKAAAVNRLTLRNVPDTLQDLLTSRLDQLGEAKLVAQVGAAIGRSFSEETLAALVPISRVDLRTALNRLESETLLRKAGAGSGTYEFRHALVQEAANDSLLRSSRQTLHLRIAEVLERDFPAMWTAQPEQLARHYSEGMQFAKAAGFWFQAGQLASQRSANLEAVNHLHQALQSLRQLPMDKQRQQRELQVRVALGPALIATQGPASPVVEENYQQALRVAEELPVSDLHFAAQWGWWRVGHNFRIMHERALRLLELAEQLADPGLMLQAHHSLWASLYHLGEQSACYRHIEAGLQCYESGDYRAHAMVYGGHDAKVCGLGEAAQTLWLLGYPDQSLQRLQAALDHAARLNHTGSLLHALDMGMLVHRYRKEPEQVIELANRVRPLAEQDGFPDYLAKATFFEGWAIAMQDRSGQGLAIMTAAFDELQGVGTSEDFPVYCDMLTEICLVLGQPERGPQYLRAGLKVIERNCVFTWLAELHRCNGELSLILQPDAPELAWRHYLVAQRVATNQQVLSLQLRVAMSEAELLSRQQRGGKALQRLSAVYQSFREGFDSHDLQRAKALLEQLGAQVP